MPPEQKEQLREEFIREWSQHQRIWRIDKDNPEMSSLVSVDELFDWFSTLLSEQRAKVLEEVISKLDRFGGFCVNCKDRFKDILTKKEATQEDIINVLTNLK